ncbi:MAG TPA: GspH/FimT family pseudopilin [Geminicoccaceae bacterium]|nr:GspH/FimT family pseudopilin [Geminicoccaceae bacterium]
MAAERGFTLIELMVVLAIVGLMLVLVPGFLWRSQPGVEVRVAARALADGLRQTRSDALAANRERVFTVDVAERHFRPGQDRPLEPLNGALELDLETARSELVDAGSGQIRFFPDGSSTGGRITVTMQEQRAAVVVDWLTGQVDIGDVRP